MRLLRGEAKRGTKRKRGKASVPRSSLKRHREPLASTREGHPPPQMEPGANPAADSAAQALPSPEKVDATVPPWRRSIAKHAKLTSSAFRGKSIRAMPRIPFKSTSNLAAPSTPEGLKSRNLQRGVSPTPAPSMRSHHCCPGTPQSQDEAPDTFESLRDASASSPLGHGAATHKAVARIRAPTMEAMDAQRSDKDIPCMKVFSVALCLAFLRFCCHCREWCRSLCHM